MWMNTVDAPALIPVIHSAWETSSPLFKYSFQFLVALRSLIALKKKKKKHQVLKICQPKSQFVERVCPFALFWPGQNLVISF